MSFDRCDRCGKPWANHTTACDFGQTTLTFALPPTPASGEVHTPDCIARARVRPDRPFCTCNPFPPLPTSDTPERGRMSEEEFEREFDSDRFYNAYHAASRLIDEARRARESEAAWIKDATTLSDARDRMHEEIAALRAEVETAKKEIARRIEEDVAEIRRAEAEAARLREALSALWRALSALYEERKIIREKRESFGGIAPHPDTMAQAAATLKEKP